MNTIHISGRTFHGARSVSIINGRVIIDGVEQTDSISGVVEIKIEGILGELRTDAAVTCTEVRGSVSAGGSVHAGNVGGTVQAGGSVNCGAVSGSVMAGGSVRHG